MHRFVVALSTLGILLLASCASASIEVHNSNGKVIGSIDVQGVKSASLMNAYGDVRGKVRGNVVRDDTGKNIGTIEERDGHMMMLDATGGALGSLENGKDCYGKGHDKLGTISGEVEATVAAGACLVFFLQ